MDNYSCLNRNEILTYVTTWVNFEDIMLREISQSQNGQTPYDSTYMRCLEQSNS